MSGDRINPHTHISGVMLYVYQLSYQALIWNTPGSDHDMRSLWHPATIYSRCNELVMSYCNKLVMSYI